MEQNKYYIYEKCNSQEILHQVLQNEPYFTNWVEIPNEEEEQGLKSSMLVWKPNNLTDE